MIVLVLIIFFIMTYGITIESRFNDKYCDINQTKQIEGIFVIFVFFGHYLSYISFSGIFGEFVTNYFSFTGQCVVAMFLFYSGFGVSQAIKNQGRAYVNKLPLKVVKLLFRADLAILLFIPLNILLNKNISINKILLSLIFWEDIGNSNWYIFAIICMYLFSFLSNVINSLFFKREFVSTILLALLSVFYIMIMKDIKPNHWHNTILCYTLGVWFSFARNIIEKNMKKYIWLFAMCALLLVYHYSHNRISSIAGYLVWTSCFSLIIVLLSMRITFNNPVLTFLGKHVFGFYVLQRIPMIFFSECVDIESQPGIYFILCFIITTIMVLMYEVVLDIINRVIKKIMVKKYNKTDFRLRK